MVLLLASSYNASTFREEVEWMKNKLIGGIGVNARSCSIRFEILLKPSKHWLLLDILCRYSLLDLRGIAELLNVEHGKVLSVLRKKDVFDVHTAERLSQYFCLCCSDVSMVDSVDVQE